MSCHREHCALFLVRVQSTRHRELGHLGRPAQYGFLQHLDRLFVHASVDFVGRNTYDLNRRFMPQLNICRSCIQYLNHHNNSLMSINSIITIGITILCEIIVQTFDQSHVIHSTRNQGPPRQNFYYERRESPRPGHVTSKQRGNPGRSKLNVEN